MGKSRHPFKGRRPTLWSGDRIVENGYRVKWDVWAAGKFGNRFVYGGNDAKEGEKWPDAREVEVDCTYELMGRRDEWDPEHKEAWPFKGGGDSLSIETRGETEKRGFRGVCFQYANLRVSLVEDSNCIQAWGVALCGCCAWVCGGVFWGEKMCRTFEWRGETCKTAI